MTLRELRERYQQERGDKYAYFAEMFDTHRRLYEYPDLLKESPVRRIDISPEGVLFEMTHRGQLIRMCVDPHDAHALPLTLLNFGAYDETAESDLVLQMIKPGDTVFDIGANLGWYTIKIRLRHPSTTVYSFEPIPSSYALLRRNLQLNGLSADLAFNFGLSNENKTVSFFFDTRCTMASSMADLRQHPETIAVECQVRRLDDVLPSFQGLQRLDFIKCDVEGAELLVYQGGVSTINRFRPIVFSEILRKWAKKFGYHPNDVLTFFRDLGYECFILENGHLTKFGTVDDTTVATNYFFLHRESHAALIAAFTGLTA